MSDRHWSGSWAVTLTREQREAVKTIRRAHNGQGKGNSGSTGWMVYMMPSTRQPKYLELRHYLGGGSVSRWVIEKDGSVSADNDRGQLRELKPV